MVQPIKVNRLDLVEQYKYLLNNASNMEVIEINTTIAVKAAELRAKYNLKTPDTIQMATALEPNAAYFLTNDIRLKTVKEITTITVSEI
ncbi:hypothetical protein AHMF7605_07615 [Adhaeribacter arboris]|uniref:PIN domain-containing protein n=1 Tax=Adhaeribacter arboris TaxID=2072846 RepID=A0A2T2YD26_9BACT|nr:PIN domain-containing protein [Adhaeribacter arboris]PSR53404.1 hypothetical protein AHMF7605_07615 [Adhaeribacter arboris]